MCHLMSDDFDDLDDLDDSLSDISSHYILISNLIRTMDIRDVLKKIVHQRHNAVDQRELMLVCDMLEKWENNLFNRLFMAMHGKDDQPIDHSTIESMLAVVDQEMNPKSWPNTT